MSIHWGHADLLQSHMGDVAEKMRGNRCAPAAASQFVFFDISLQRDYH
jgi:hypothetical protein